MDSEAVRVEPQVPQPGSDFRLSGQPGRKPGPDGDFSGCWATPRCPFRKSPASSDRYRARTYGPGAGQGLTKRSSSDLGPGRVGARLGRTSQFVAESNIRSEPPTR